MQPQEQLQQKWLIGIAILCAASIHVSIALSQSLLGIGVGLQLLWRRRLPFPPIWRPLLAFFLLTVIATILSPDPVKGLPHVKKFYVFLLIPFLFDVFSHRFDRVRILVMAWAIAASASGLYGILQFVARYRQLAEMHADFYTNYVGRRITGFESHWMTFGALQLSVLMLLVAQLAFARKPMPKWAYLSVPVLGTAIVLGWTRSIWLAAVGSLLYLVWCWKPKATILVPAVLAISFVFAPGAMKARMQSLTSPHGDTDSNQHRTVTFRTGLEMIKAHPWFGLGTEQIKPQFDAYVPKDISRPLPTGFYGHLHNIYLQYAAERGVFALLAVLWLFVQIFIDCSRELRTLGKGRSERKFILHGTIATLIGIMIGGIFEHNLGDSEVLMMFVSVIALGYAAIAAKRYKHKHEPALKSEAAT